MESLETLYQKRLTTWMEECKTNIKIYENDFREDEATLEKIKLNVYDIFFKVFTISLNKTDTLDAFKSMYLGYHKNIPKNWHAAREQAKKQDTIDVYIEDVKIQTANQIEKFFLNVWDNYEQSKTL